MKENWKEIKIKDSAFLLSNTGKVYSKHYKRELKGTKNQKGYLSLDVSFYKNGKRKRQCPSIHSLVAKLFIGPRPEGYQINHKDGNKQNNNVINLEYVTGSANVQHALKKGFCKKHLNESQVLQVVKLYDKNKDINRIICETKLKRETIVSIVTGRTYSFITDITPRRHYYRLSENEVKEIIELLKTDIPQKEIAEKYNISKPTICDIKAKRSWKYIKRN